MRYAGDLITIGLATAALLVAIVTFPHSPVRVALGLPFVLFFPGYCLIAGLYPRRDDLDGVERLALSLGLSLAVVPLIGLALNFTPWGIRLVPITAGLTLFIGTTSLIAAYRRLLMPPGDRFSADVRPVLWALKQIRWPLVATGVAVVGIVLLLSFRLGVLGGSRVGETFTEFYVLGPAGKAEGYPRQLTVGESGEVIIGIVNHEERVARYTFDLRADTRVLRMHGPIVLAGGQKWERPVSFSLNRPAGRLRVAFTLYIDGRSEPYRTLHLWLQVRAPRSGNP